ncbi:MAG: LacI family DNA-binding transcriptional regulator [Patescibacteria group bacterium]
MTRTSTTTTIRDLAKLAGVSIGTVSLALNNRPGVSEATRRRVLELAAKADYQPHAIARQLALRRTRCIGLVILNIRRHAEIYPSSWSYFYHIILGINDTLRTRGYKLDLEICDVDDMHGPTLFDFAGRGALDGLFIVLQWDKQPTSLLKAIESNIPIVLINGALTEDLAAVGVDNYGVAENAVDHLHSLGHTEIAFIGGPFDHLNVQDRLAGFKQAMQKRGLPITEHRIVESDFQIAGGYRAMMRILGKDERVTAVFCANDLMAVGAVQAIQHRGLRVPDDISVVGTDDDLTGQVITPPLTTIRQPVRQMGIEAAQQLLQLIDGSGNRRRLFLASELIRRRSTGPRSREPVSPGKGG